MDHTPPLDRLVSELNASGTALPAQAPRLEEWLTTHLPSPLQDLGDQILGKPILARTASIL